MEELMEMLECIEDNRQQSKVRYPIKEIVLIVFSDYTHERKSSPEAAKL